MSNETQEQIALNLQTLDDWMHTNLTADHTDWTVQMWYVQDKLEVPFVKERANFFKENIEAADEFIQLPFYMAAMPEVTSDIAKFNEHFAKAFELLPAAKPQLIEVMEQLKMLKNNHELDAINFTEEFSAFASEALDCVYLYLSYQGKSANEKMKAAIRPMLEAREKTRFSIEQMYRASASAYWTAFEVLAADLWEESLNSAAEKLASRVLKEKGSFESDGLTQKQISVEMLCRYGFDLRNSMGTLLKPKFDFSGIHGIEKAFRVLFNIESIGWKDEVRERLSLLEQTRHIIQHRAGFIDQKYVDFAKGSAKLGNRVIVTARELEEFKKAVVEASWMLLFHTDYWFRKNSRNAQY